jgi:hypothetical protein
MMSYNPDPCLHPRSYSVALQSTREEVLLLKMERIHLLSVQPSHNKHVRAHVLGFVGRVHVLR